MLTVSEGYLSHLSRLARALWIEIVDPRFLELALLSRLARALWIEIGFAPLVCVRLVVEARESLVD